MPWQKVTSCPGIRRRATEFICWFNRHIPTAWRAGTKQMPSENTRVSEWGKEWINEWIGSHWARHQLGSRTFQPGKKDISCQPDTPSTDLGGFGDHDLQRLRLFLSRVTAGQLQFSWTLFLPMCQPIKAVFLEIVHSVKQLSFSLPWPYFCTSHLP